MKNYLMIAVIALLSLSLTDAFARGSSHGSYKSKSYGGTSHSYSGSRDHSVRGYTRKDGTYVAPHHATNPNSTKRDNYSSQGNVNPYTGKPGTVDPDK